MQKQINLDCSWILLNHYKKLQINWTVVDFQTGSPNDGTRHLLADASKQISVRIYHGSVADLINKYLFDNKIVQDCLEDPQLFLKQSKKRSSMNLNQILMKLNNQIQI